MAQSIVQQSTIRKWVNTTTPTVAPSLAGVTSGNDIVALLTLDTFAGSAASVTINDGSSYTSEASRLFDSGSQSLSAIFRLRNVSSGTHTCTCTANHASYGQILLCEVFGDANSAVDKTAVNSGSSTTPSVGPTGTLTQTNEIAFAVVGVPNGAAGITSPPTGGWTSLYLDVGGGIMDCSFSYQVVSANTALSANWGTLSGSSPWGAVIATFLGSAAAPSVFPYIRKRRIFLPVFIPRNT